MTRRAVLSKPTTEPSATTTKTSAKMYLLTTIIHYQESHALTELAEQLIKPNSHKTLPSNPVELLAIGAVSTKLRIMETLMLKGPRGPIGARINSPIKYECLRSSIALNIVRNMDIQT
mmetsp:Transcript_29315/g.5294  ORF Transcript_29315/g.5294 Transcript_29315/m.5294 type:complete len:118 (-) Transcript_29315:11-364(-)